MDRKYKSTGGAIKLSHNREEIKCKKEREKEREGEGEGEGEGGREKKNGKVKKTKMVVGKKSREHIAGLFKERKKNHKDIWYFCCSLAHLAVSLVDWLKAEVLLVFLINSVTQS